MTFVWTTAAAALLTASLVSSVTAAEAWRLRSRSPGGGFFAAMMISIVTWCLAAGLEAAAVGVPAKVLFSKIGYLGICSVAPLFLSFAFSYGGKRHILTPLLTVLVWLLPVVTLVLALTNEWHHLIWTAFTSAQQGSGNLLLYGHGPWYWVWVFYAAAATCAGTAVLVQSALGCKPFFLRQTLVFLAGAALPWIGTAVYLSPANPFPGLDFPSIGFAVAGGLLLVGMAKFRLFDIVPVARADLVESMSEGLIVLDSVNRIVDLNAAAQAMLRIDATAIGRPVGEVLRTLYDIIPGERVGAAVARTQLNLPSGALDCVITSLGKGLGAGHLLTVRDSVSALLPMCASCKKVRDEAGAWQDLDDYVEAHTGLRFSHGLCDQCIARLYPEVDMGRGPKSS